MQTTIPPPHPPFGRGGCDGRRGRDVGSRCGSGGRRICGGMATRLLPPNCISPSRANRGDPMSMACQPLWSRRPHTLGSAKAQARRTSVCDHNTGGGESTEQVLPSLAHTTDSTTCPLPPPPHQSSRRAQMRRSRKRRQELPQGQLKCREHCSGWVLRDWGGTRVQQHTL
jgi:hypothetical protein